MAAGPVDILMVEDDPMDIRLMLRALAAGPAPRRVDVVRDGAEALDYLFCQAIYAQRPAGQRPKLILLDLKLPKIDGLQVLAAIKSDPCTRAIPVAILTSSGEEKDLTVSYRMGANSYIQKPFDLIELQDAIKTLERYWIDLNQCPPESAFGA